jgi:replicative DNA helicase
MIEELDLKILKSIVNDKVTALTFSSKYDHSLFEPDAQRFAKLVLDYTKHYRSPPTKRTLLEQHAGNPLLTSIIEDSWRELDELEYDTREYPYDLAQLKKRFQLQAVEDIRDQAAIDDPDTPQNPEEYFNKLSLAINRITSIELERTYTQKPVGDYVEEFSDSYEARKLNPEALVEIKTGYSVVDVYGGVSPGELVMIGGESNAGKALKLDTPIPTPAGWSTIGELKIGDSIFGDDGNICQVIAKSEVFVDHDCYEIEFSDGEKIIADAGHLWKTFSFSERRQCLKNTDKYRASRRESRHRRGKGLSPWTVKMNQERIYKVKSIPTPSIKNTKEIFDSVKVITRKNLPYNHSIAPTDYLKLEEKELLIDPYVFGAWLGDGDSGQGGITSNDIEIIKEIEAAGYVVKKWKSKYHWGIFGLLSQLKKLGVFNNKHIPISYLRSSYNQRVALLQGLMDTDGTVRNSGICEFTTTKPILRDNVLELIRSLGLVARCNEGLAKLNGIIIGPKYNISFRTSISAFRLPRKLSLQKRSGFKFNHRMIVSVIKVSSIPVQCIQVDSPSCCFLCGKSMIPTHNSQLLSNMAKQIWLQGNTIESSASTSMVRGHNVLYFSLEMPYEDCFIRFLASLANVPQRGLVKATLSHEEELRVNKAKEFIKEYQNSGYFFDIVDVPRNLTIEEVELRYNDAMLRYRPDVVVIDYMGLMHSTTLAKEQDWLKLGGIAASIHEFGRAYDNAMITAAQLTDLKRNSSGTKNDDGKAVGMHRWGRSSLIMHHVNLGIQIETRPNEMSFPDMKIHVVKDRKGALRQGSLIKNFANASLIDIPYDQKSIPGDISANIPDLIRSIQESKNKG